MCIAKLLVSSFATGRSDFCFLAFNISLVMIAHYDWRYVHVLFCTNINVTLTGGTRQDANVGVPQYFGQNIEL